MANTLSCPFTSFLTWKTERVKANNKFLFMYNAFIYVAWKANNKAWEKEKKIFIRNKKANNFFSHIFFFHFPSYLCFPHSHAHHLSWCQYLFAIIPRAAYSGFLPFSIACSMRYIFRIHKVLSQQLQTVLLESSRLGTKCDHRGKSWWA